MLASSRSVLCDRYELGPVIGRGGMAEVRTAHDRRLRRTVAVKCFDPAAWATPHGRARFEVEARAGAAVSHPNVVTVYDVGVDVGMPFIVMERLSGRTFADELERGPAPVERVLDVMRALLDAVAAAHARGVLHRDLKPANVLLTDDDTPKLSDFGIAMSGDVTRGLTQTGLVLGTPAYLAPERVEGKPATARSDLYSIGVMCYEALTGCRPYEGDNAVAVAYAARHGILRPVRELRADVPAELAAVVCRAMARLPDDRFATAQELAGALAAAAGSTKHVVDATSPVDVRPPTTPTRVLAVAPAPAPPARRRTRLAVLGAIAVLALLAGAVAFSHDTAGLKFPAPGPTAPSRTNATLPSGLEAPFQRLQHAVDR
ncbi:MAG TPA: serine/threonine-protein kinase [Acidimicrobiia bacterium]|nr:serine/threonine-protein kinase [Acidimicrobiia bacterium]